MRDSIFFAIGAVIMLAPSAASSHFVLVEPGIYLVQNEIGDPQKLAPCGGTSADQGTPSNVLGQYRGGDMLHIKIREAIFHPGHYRAALAVNSRGELPEDPETTTREGPSGSVSVSAEIDPNPNQPVMADGLFVHTERPAPGSFFETDVRLSNINCEKCTLQVVQWMGEHALNLDGEYSYHHCAEIGITANPALPIDTKWPTQSVARR